jgi:Flp pilus assembly pilin Flp
VSASRPKNLELYRRRGRDWCVLLRLLAADTRGQDLIEYALLSAVVGLAALATMNALGITMGSAYANWNAAVNALWESPPP